MNMIWSLYRLLIRLLRRYLITVFLGLEWEDLCFNDIFKMSKCGPPTISYKSWVDLLSGGPRGLSGAGQLVAGNGFENDAGFRSRTDYIYECVFL